MCKLLYFQFFNRNHNCIDAGIRSNIDVRTDSALVTQN